MVDFYRTCAVGQINDAHDGALEGETMRLNIKNPETDRLVRELADLTGDSLTGAVTKAAQERLTEIGRPRDAARVPDGIEHRTEPCGQDGQTT